MSNQKLQTSVQYLQGVGPKLAQVFGRLGVRTVEDLLYLLPHRYEDRSQIQPIVKVRAGQVELIKGEIIRVDQQQTRNRFHILKVQLSDRTASIQAVWFNQPYLARLFRPGMRLIVSGKVEHSSYEGCLQILIRDYEIDTGEPPGIVPKYPLTEGLYPKKLRAVVKTAIDSYLKYVEDPKEKNALKTLHLPAKMTGLEKARDYLAFQELLTFQLGLLLLHKKYAEELQGNAYQISTAELEAFIKSLPFTLTAAQQRVLSEIKSDLASQRPMNRLLQGDVGSGKTVLAALAAWIVIRNGYQVAIFAPTEILAQQHYAKLKVFFEGQKFRVGLRTATANRQLKKAEEITEELVVGTHALIEAKVKFQHLGLVIIDEQHRFGVEQRLKLIKKGFSPDVLVMSATPIPRSLALTLYGDLDRSIIDQLPPGRLPVKTYYVPEKKRAGAYEFIRQKIKESRQVFVVCPLVKESEASDLKAAAEEAERLQRTVFPDLKVGLLHGQMKGEEKERVMTAFQKGALDILVSTTVIEVGIDIPNANVMLVEHAERFGLAQLHQLRGRIGRGSDQAVCFLVGAPKSPEAKARLEVMIKTTDGFEIAEQDLRLRGPGDAWGIRQSGLPNFRVADIIRDEKILLAARQAAAALIAKDPEGARNRWESQRYKIEGPAKGAGSEAAN